MQRSRRQRDTHYEVHGFRKNHWILLEVLETRDEAAELAERSYRSGAYQAVRVLRERFDPGEGAYDSLEILLLGRKRKPSKHDSSMPAVFCRTAPDLYTPEARRTITRLLAPLLDGLELTTVEILYSLDNYRRVEAAGTRLLQAVQQAAVAQVRETGEPVAERIRQIQSVISSALAALRRAEESGRPRIGEGRFVDLVARMKNLGDKEFLLSMALADDLCTQEGTRAKLGRLLSLMRFDHPLWALEILDLFLSEQLQHRRLIQTLLPAQALIDRLELIAALARGDLDGRDVPDEAQMLARFMTARLLPKCRDVLIEHIVYELNTKRRFTGEGLVGEFAALGRLMTALGEPVISVLGESSLREMIEDRCARLLNPQSLGDFLALAPTPAEKLTRLLDLEQQTIGDANRRVLARYMIPLVTMSNHEAFWTRPAAANVRGRLQLLARLQRRVLASDLASGYKSRIGGALDDMCLKIIRANGVFERLAGADMPPSRRAESLLAMMAEGCFTEGKARAAAEAEAVRHMANPAFLEPLSQAENREERDAAIARLRRLLTEAGVAAPGSL
ncbi:MAG: hypothetical protein ACE5ED_09565 [Rhodothalassiaceae bacterium]